MRNLIALVATTCWALVLMPAGHCQETPKRPTFAVEAIKDVSYHSGKDADPDRHKLDLYVPKGKKDFPVLLFIHGGGYQRGDRKDAEAFGRTLASLGIGVAPISYRLYPQVKHPGHMEDVARAFAWTQRNIAKHGGNPANLFVSGHSAGAHMASLLATDDRYLKRENLSLKEIKGVLAISGGYRIQPIRMAVFGDEEAMRQASPFTHIKGSHPPFLIFYGDKESPERDKLSHEFRDALRKAGGQADCIEIKDRDHQGLFKKIEPGDPTALAIESFIAKHARVGPVEK